MEYPNLELVTYKALQLLQNDTDFKEKLANARPDFELDVFSQIWGSTSLGFGGFGGQAITRAYTTVVHELVTDTYIVFFGGRPAYKVDNATDNFYSDLTDRRLKSVEEASKWY